MSDGCNMCGAYKIATNDKSFELSRWTSLRMRIYLRVQLAISSSCIYSMAIDCNTVVQYYRRRKASLASSAPTPVDLSTSNQSSYGFQSIQAIYHPVCGCSHNCTTGIAILDRLHTTPKAFWLKTNNRTKNHNNNNDKKKVIRVVAMSTTHQKFLHFITKINFTFTLQYGIFYCDTIFIPDELTTHKFSGYQSVWLILLSKTCIKLSRLRSRSSWNPLCYSNCLTNLCQTYCNAAGNKAPKSTKSTHFIYLWQWNRFSRLNFVELKLSYIN